MIYVKRLLATCAALALTATSTLPMTAAAISFESATDSQTIKAGDTITYDVTITDNDGVNGWQLLVEFDSDKLTYEKITKKDIVEKVNGYPDMEISSQIVNPARKADVAGKNSVPILWSQATATYDDIFESKGKDVPAEVAGKNYVFVGDNSGNPVAQIVFTAKTDIAESELKNLVNVSGTKASRNNETGSESVDVDITVDNVVKEKPPVEVTIKLDKSSATLAKGKTGTLKATVTGTDEAVTWTSSNANVATVDANGKVTAIGAGDATITASVADKSATCKITVTDTTQPVVIPIPDQTVEKDKSIDCDLTMFIPSATAQMVAALNVAIDDPTVVSYSVDGTTVSFKGLKEGVAKVTVTSPSPNYEFTPFNITVTAAPITELDLDDQTVAEGKSVNYDISEDIPSTIVSNVTVKSLSPDVATVEFNADKTALVITGKTAGVAKAQVTDADGNVLGSFNITVTPAGTTPVTELDLPDQTVTEGLTSSYNISNAILAAIVPNLKVESLDPDVATVAFSSDNKSLVITGKKPGVAKAQVTDTNGNVLGTFNITVEAAPEETEFTADFAEKNIDLKLGSTYQLRIVVDPENEDTAEFKDITKWTLTSSDKTIVSVNANGTLTGLRSGEVTITATNPDYSKELKCNVVVKSTFPVYVPVSGIINPGETVVPKPGDNKVDRAKVTPYVNAIVDSESKAGVIAATGGEMDSETGNAPAIAAAALGLIALGFVVVARKKRHS